VQKGALNIHVHTENPNTEPDAKLWSSRSQGNHIFKVFRFLKMQNLPSCKALKWADFHLTVDPRGLTATNKHSAVSGKMGNAVNPVY